MSEPTTGEIAFELRNMNPKHLIIKGDGVTVEDVAADRLESQKQLIDALLELLAKKDEDIADLTARAEQAERERDEAMDEMYLYASMPDDRKSTAVAIEVRRQNILSYVRRWRGLPQDGEGK